MPKQRKGRQRGATSASTLPRKGDTILHNDTPPVTDLSTRPDISVLMAPGAQRRHSMRGFEAQYVDIVDYIVRITHKIWEEGSVGYIYETYNHDAIVHSSYGTTYTRDEVVASTVAGIQAFPNARAYAHDVVWCGNDVDGFYSSHRVLSVSHNTGYTRYGPPTGRKVVGRSFADCLVKENRIVEEWIVRDEMGGVRQLGFSVEQAVATLVGRELAARRQPEPVAAVGQVMGQTTPAILPPSTAEGFDIEDFIKRTWHEVWNWRYLDRVYERYAPTFQSHTPGGCHRYGQEEYIQFVLSVLACFPDGRMFVEHFCALGNDEAGYRAAIRWRFIGTHLGYGLYGEPTGKRASVPGISHHHVKRGKIVEEWTVFDEIALLVQLATPD